MLKFCLRFLPLKAFFMLGREFAKNGGSKPPPYSISGEMLAGRVRSRLYSAVRLSWFNITLLNPS